MTTASKQLTVGQRAWAAARANLFATPLDTIVTLACVALVVKVVPPLLDWLLFNAVFRGEGREACHEGGACWVFIRVRFSQFLYGFYPEGQIWRVNVAMATLFLSMVPMFKKTMARRKLWLPIAMILGPAVALIFLHGGVFGLERVETALWGGLMMTFIISYAGIVVSLPLGILLALGRRSRLPVLSTLSICFIEVWRGVPLITVLFMASVMLPLFLPDGMDVDKLLRALIGVSMFASAYMAEVVRGGLQAIPKGQIEAAEALGLNYWQTMLQVVLPQALKKVIPGIVNTFIGLFKDTTLVLIIGMFDLLGMIQAALSDGNWLGLALEGYVFAGCVYWILCYSMSRYSQSLERALNRD